MTNIHDKNIELLNDIFLIVSGTDLSKSKINRNAIFAYLHREIEAEETNLINISKGIDVDLMHGIMKAMEINFINSRK